MIIINMNLSICFCPEPETAPKVFWPNIINYLECKMSEMCRKLNNLILSQAQQPDLTLLIQAFQLIST